MPSSISGPSTSRTTATAACASRSAGRGAPVSPSTVKRELGLFKRVIDFRRRRLGIIVNPVNMDDVKRPLVIDERDVRLVRGTEYTFPMIFLH